jgi:hypothetical protein
MFFRGKPRGSQDSLDGNGGGGRFWSCCHGYFRSATTIFAVVMA